MDSNPHFLSPLLLSDNDFSKMGGQQVSYQINGVSEHNSDFLRPKFFEVIEEIKQISVIALPMILTGLVIYTKSAISMFFMGKIGKEMLSGGSLGIGIANITGYSIIFGIATGMEPISSQACGAQQWALMGHALQRTILILLLTSLPISFLWLNFESLSLILGFNPLISSIASDFLAYSVPALFFQSLINPLKIYLRTQKITFPLLLSAALSLFIHAPISYIFFRFGLGIKGIAMAGSLTDLNMLITLSFYLFFSGICRKSWNGWSLECLKEWKPIIRQSIPSCVSVCLEWWWYELMIVLSGLFTNASEAVATMGILIQATSLLYTFPFALNQAVSTRVGNELGANRPEKAKTAAMTALSCAIGIGFMAMLFMVTMRNFWGRVFTTDVGILSLVAEAMPVVGMCEVGNCLQTAVCGVLRGSARASLGAVINFSSFYGIGLPIAVFVGFRMGMGLPGLWFGLLAAQVVCAVVMTVVLMRTDWVVEADRARELTGSSIDGDNQIDC